MAQWLYILYLQNCTFMLIFKEVLSIKVASNNNYMKQFMLNNDMAQ